MPFTEFAGDAAQQGRVGRQASGGFMPKKMAFREVFSGFSGHIEARWAAVVLRLDCYRTSFKQGVEMAAAAATGVAPHVLGTNSGLHLAGLP